MARRGAKKKAPKKKAPAKKKRPPARPGAGGGAAADLQAAAAGMMSAEERRADALDLATNPKRRAERRTLARKFRRLGLGPDALRVPTPKPKPKPLHPTFTQGLLGSLRKISNHE
jgi:hypothetical protein